jgi:hypothetical protein
MTDPRDEFIRAVVGGKTFADVGGLWGTVNEKVSVAHGSGAREVTMLDVSPPERPLWADFRRRCQELGVGPVHCLSQDVLAVGPDPSRAWDVVHCSGVLYHMPDPVRFLVALHRLCREHLILTSVVTATEIVSSAGILAVPGSAAIYVPALSGHEREVLRIYWTGVVGDGAIGLTRDVDQWRVEDYGPWWWLPTVETLKGLCVSTGFEVIKDSPSWNGNAHTLLLRA